MFLIQTKFCNCTEVNSFLLLKQKVQLKKSKNVERRFFFKAAAVWTYSSPTHKHTHTFCLSFSLSLSHTHTHTHTLNLFLSVFLSHNLHPSLSNSHSIFYSHTHTHTRRVSKESRARRKRGRTMVKGANAIFGQNLKGVFFAFLT